MNTKKHWDDKWSRDQGVYSDEHENLYKEVLPYLKGEVVDLGCGSALVGRSVGKRYHGVDFSESGIELAKKNCPDGTFKVCDCRYTDWEDKSFDTVLLSAVVEHFKLYGLLLAEAERLCRGRIIIVVPLNSRGAEHYYPHWPMWRCLEAFNAYGEVVEYKQIKKHPRSKPCWALVVIEPV
jgi:ubiquinone/menaquinone biosynthesis C-methylase UbiE